MYSWYTEKLTPFRALASDRVVDNITKLARMSRNPRRIHDVKKGGTQVPLHPLQRIILSQNPGGLSPPREDYHLSPCRFRTVTPICREK